MKPSRDHSSFLAMNNPANWQQESNVPTPKQQNDHWRYRLMVKRARKPMTVADLNASMPRTVKKEEASD